MDSIYIPLFSALVGALIGAGVSIITVWIQAKIGDRRAMQRIASELAMEEWKAHLAQAQIAADKGQGRQGVNPPGLYLYINTELLKLFDKKGKVSAEELDKIYDDTEVFMDAVEDWSAKRRAARSSKGKKTT